MEDCLPDQVRVDHGREFYLTLFVQESLVPLRTNTQRDPHRQTESKKGDHLPLQTYFRSPSSKHTFQKCKKNVHFLEAVNKAYSRSHIFCLPFTIPNLSTYFLCFLFQVIEEPQN